MTLERFKKLGPPIFQGTTDPLVAEAWLKQVKKIFIAMGSDTDHRVVLTSFSLLGEAYHWWDVRAHLLNAQLDGRPIT